MLYLFQDNDFLQRGHRPPLPSFRACFKSIFRIHTETGNIWTHMLGCVAFIGKFVFRIQLNLFLLFRFRLCIFIIVVLNFRHSNLFPDASHSRNRTARENCFRCLLRRSHHLSGMLFHISHRQLSLSIRGQALFETRLLRHSIVDYGQFCAMAVLRFLLSFQA